MSQATPRMRMFAGPNGSGKSVLKAYLPAKLLGTYLNPDEIEAGIRRDGFLDLIAFGVDTTAEEVRAVFAGSEFLKAEGLATQAQRIGLLDGRIHFNGVPVDSYFASVATDFLRTKLLDQRRSFTIETVMSHPGKVRMLEQAQQLGYRTYLYYVATDDPEINVSRVRNRVGLGGHPVPEVKIITRYHRSLSLLFDAIRQVNRAYIFDNSTDSTERRHTWLAEITDGKTMELKTDRVPDWFKRAVLDRIDGGDRVAAR